MRGWTHRTRWTTLQAASAAVACVRNTAGATTVPGGTEVLSADEFRRPEEAEPAVYLDHRPFRSVRMLSDIPANAVLEGRHFSSAQDQMKYGAGHSQGAILVITGSPR